MRRVFLFMFTVMCFSGILSEAVYAGVMTYSGNDYRSTGYGISLDDFKQQINYTPEPVQKSWLSSLWQRCTCFVIQTLPEVFSKVNNFFADIKIKIIEFFRPVAAEKPLEKGYLK